MLQNIYADRFNNFLVPIAIEIEKDLKAKLSGISHIDRISSRAKSIERFILKSEKMEALGKKYKEPLKQIQDQIGVRVVTFYLDDVEKVSDEVVKYYNKIEEKSLVPDSEKEFGYEGKHFILFIPPEFLPSGGDKELLPVFFELQIKTLYQHAFSEASHDLAYKPSRELTKDQKRKIAFTAAQSWGADQIFRELFLDLNR